MIRIHEDRTLFQESVKFTAAKSGFDTRLIEKDYFCSVLLEYLTADGSLVFKGGTCLTKVYTDFCRLSEDLDFMIPTAEGASRSERSRAADPFKKMMRSLEERLAAFQIVKQVAGANNSTQYVGAVSYASLFGREIETIKIEVALREPLLLSVNSLPAKCILMDPQSEDTVVPPITSKCLSKTEAFAEKFRAALTRREVVIRDFFDIEYAARHGVIQPDSPELLKLVAKKIAMPGNAPVDVSGPRMAELREQVEPDLKPVLRSADFQAFDLDRAIEIATEMAKRLESLAAA